VRRSPALVEQTKFCQQKRAGADTGSQLCTLVLLANPAEQAPILSLASRALTAWHNENIQGRVLLSGHMWLNKQVATAGENTVLFCDGEHAKQPVFIAVFVRIDQARCREYLERATEIEHLDIIEKKDTNGWALLLHRNTSFQRQWTTGMVRAVTAAQAFRWSSQPARASQRVAVKGGTNSYPVFNR
jgi:hypothetical protein